MTLRFVSVPAAFVIVTALIASSAPAQTRATASASPYGGNVVEDILARVNDQIITRSDYDRAMQELDQEQRQRGASMQEISAGHKDLLRNLIDQQLWLSKGKELGVNGETELVNRLNEIRKQYNLTSLEDLEKAAHDQGVSYEDFKANIRNQIITQDVMRDEVGRRISITPGEVQQYFEAHKQDYAQPESVKLGEILVSTGAPSNTQLGAATEDPAAVAAAQTKANDIEAKLHAGGDFSQLAKSFSDGTTASEGGDLGNYKRGQLNKVFEDQVFTMKAGQVTDPIRTKQGFVIFKVVEHTPGGVPAFKDVESDVEQNYFSTRMEPAIRDYLTKMRDDAYLEIKPGYVDTGASPNKRVFPIAYSAYTPPSPKKKRKVERTRFRETTHTFRQKATPVALTSDQTAASATSAKKKKDKTDTTQQAAMKPGKKEKIRFGKAPQETLPDKPTAQTEDAGALPQTQTASAVTEPENPLEATPAPKKSRFSDRAKEPKQPKAKAVVQEQRDKMTPEAPESGEVADRQTQSAPLGLGGDTASKKKKKQTATTGEKTRLSDQKKPAETGPAPEPTTPAPVQGAPAPEAPAPDQPSTPQAAPSTPQQ
ncbi:MAG TPA: peptidylprolyl isomerase [Terracidiphilus sp.]|jgi:peptidyl-prolyl cis-trans isomerase SurA|nr:peptidylprolyl isomerase [Terracidiphilus sp.]